MGIPWQNIAGSLQAAASSLEKVVRCTVFLQSLEDFAAMNQVYATFFPAHPTARSTVEVARLPQDCLVKIDAIALA
jgi:2-iminobutanoate/2-iminopropanoate deaminase